MRTSWQKVDRWLHRGTVALIVFAAGYTLGLLIGAVKIIACHGGGH